jgi:hypothetical protein
VPQQFMPVHAFKLPVGSSVVGWLVGLTKQQGTHTSNTAVAAASCCFVRRSKRLPAFLVYPCCSRAYPCVISCRDHCACMQFMSYSYLCGCWDQWGVDHVLLLLLLPLP